ncbi:MAG: hypothetical protein ABIQ88_02235 [Chitinophagaceae bacterium]
MAGIQFLQRNSPTKKTAGSEREKQNAWMNVFELFMCMLEFLWS